MKLLIIEDEPELLATTKEYLSAVGYNCESAINLNSALDKIIQFEYDCIIVDLGLPDGNGLDLIEELKMKSANTGIIIISAKTSIEDKLQGLENGADDYLTKPFHLSELNARIKSVIRRRKFQGNKSIIFNEIKVNIDTLEVFVNKEMIALTKKELYLLIYFLENKEKVVTRESLLDHLWGEYISSSDTLDFTYTHVSNLRKKLTQSGARDYIKTIYGIGYKFSER